MFLPYQTDAPVYHLPIATVGLILVNTVMFIMLMNEPELFLEWVLPWGEFTPKRWITSNFTHGTIFHLVGNMFGLWAFGIVVEGKVGPLRMLAIVAAIGITQPMLEQIVMIGASTGGAYGFSAIVFGLMAICLIWAPENEMNCLVFLGWYVFSVELTIYNLATFMLIINFVTAIFSGLTITSEILHLIGAALGAAVGLVMLRRGWVDCENWDVFSCFKGLNRMSEEERQEYHRVHATTATSGKQQQQAAEQRALLQQKAEEEFEAATNQFRTILANGNPIAAWKLYEAARQRLPKWQLAETDMRQCIEQMHEQEFWEESVPLMVHCMRAYPANGDLLRLKLAEVLTVKSARPAQALKCLAGINLAHLTPEQQSYAQRIRVAAEQLREQDPYEVVEDW